MTIYSGGAYIRKDIYASLQLSYIRGHVFGGNLYSGFYGISVSMIFLCSVSNFSLLFGFCVHMTFWVFSCDTNMLCLFSSILLSQIFHTITASTKALGTSKSCPAASEALADWI